MPTDWEIWDGAFEFAEWDHNPSGPFLLLFDSETHGSTTIVAGGTLRKTLERFFAQRRDTHPGSMACVVDSMRKIVHGYIWNEAKDRMELAGCSVVFSELQRAGLGDPLDSVMTELVVSGNLDDLGGVDL